MAFFLKEKLKTAEGDYTDTWLQAPKVSLRRCLGWWFLRDMFDKSCFAIYGWGVQCLLELAQRILNDLQKELTEYFTVFRWFRSLGSQSPDPSRQMEPLDEGACGSATGALDHEILRSPNTGLTLCNGSSLITSLHCDYARPSPTEAP